MDYIKSFISLGAALGWLILLFYFASFLETLIRKIKGSRNKNISLNFDIKVVLFSFVCILCSVISIIPKTQLGSTQIDSLFEKLEYTEKYYVLMYPGGAKDKNYKIEADITSTIVEYESGSERKYYIERAYFSNGGYITFYNNMDWKNLKVGERVSILDDKDKYWDIELTKDRVNK